MKRIMVLLMAFSLLSPVEMQAKENTSVPDQAEEESPLLDGLDDDVVVTEENGIYIIHDEEKITNDTVAKIDPAQASDLLACNFEEAAHLHIVDDVNTSEEGLLLPGDVERYESNPYQYTYRVTPLLAPFNNYVYVETDNPYPQSFRFLDKDTMYDPGNGNYEAAFHHESLKFQEVDYTDWDTSRVNNGYLFLAYTGDPDGGELTLQYDPNGFSERKQVSAFSSNWKDTTIKVNTPKMMNYTDYVIKSYTNDSMGFFEKMDACQEALDHLAMYPFGLYEPAEPTDTPYPLYYISPYRENPLMAYYFSMFNGYYSALTFVYPFVLDSLGFPGTMSRIARQLNPDCTIEDTWSHADIKVTYNGVSKVYGGQGYGGASDLVYCSDIQSRFTFDGSADDLSKGTLDSWRKVIMDYGDHGL